MGMGDDNDKIYLCVLRDCLLLAGTGTRKSVCSTVDNASEGTKNWVRILLGFALMGFAKIFLSHLSTIYSPL